jgi:hypothetical protein
VNLVVRFVQFWIDFIVGDAWEVAATLAVALALIALVTHQWGGDRALSFVLVLVVVGVTWVALMRATAGKRRVG